MTGLDQRWNSGARRSLVWRATILALCFLSAKAATPTFSNIDGSTVLTVDEDDALNTQVISVTASDTDGNLPIEFSVTGTTDFGFDASSNILKVKAGLDYETTPSYSVTIVATDSASESAAVVITVNVQDVNDNDPTLTLTTADVTLDEEMPVGTTVDFDFSASDADTNDGTSLSYSLSGADSSIFNIVPSTGVITLNTKVDIDPNTPNKVYKPQLTVSDGTRSATGTLTLTLDDLNDNAPVCNPNTVYRSVTEETTGATVYTLTCTDEDSSFDNNNVLTYSLTSSHFSVDGSGVVTVTSAVDYEITTSETLHITVADTGGIGALDSTATVIVSITPANDNAPAWGTFVPPPTTSTYTRSENIGVGTSLFSMVATDSDDDVGSTITYSIDSVTDGTNPVSGLFNADPSTGEVTTLATLDRDGGISQYTLNLQATDGSNTISQTVFLALNDYNDIAPVFQSTPLAKVTIAETNAKTGSVVTTVSATDGDVTAATFSYDVEAVVVGATTVSDWAFDGATPGQLEFASDLDLDTGDEAIHVLRLIVKDGASPELTGSTTLTVSISDDNEHTPTISSEPAGTVPVDENESVGTSITSVVGADSDIGEEGELTYSITGGNTGTAFSIDSSGVISTLVVLDKETLDNYDLEITITDSGVSPKSVTTSVSVTVSDVNDHQPSCPALFVYITPGEDTSLNSGLTTLSCSDTDTGDTLTYSVRSPHNTQFGFTTPVNELKLLSSFDYDSATQSYLVLVDVSDGPNSQVVTVSIDVDPVNEDSPVFTTNPTVPVAENAVSNPLTTYAAVDSDYSPHGIASYAITSVTNSGSALFGIDASSGTIFLTAALDYDSLPTNDKTYELEVVATDGGGDTGTGTVTVSVSDTNDNAPTCTQATFTVDMDEHPAGAAPFDVVNPLGCTDVEDGSSLTYSLTQTPGSHFAVASDIVTLTADTLDYETSSLHTLTVKVADSGSPTALTSTVTVYVNVINMNEGGPAFGVLTAKDIDETLAIGQSVIDISAPDPDGSDPTFGDSQYSILSGDPSNHFAIDASSGLITLRKALDFESVSSYDLVIQAIERGGANSAAATQEINVTDENDEAPTCPSYSFTQTVAEDELADFVVKALGCSDTDAGTTLNYTITNGDTTLFKVEGGTLKLKASLDYESAQTHDLTIQVSDGDVNHDVDISGTVSVGSVDEGPPVFSQNVYSVDVSETESVGHSVIAVIATDPDSNTDANGQVIFSFEASYSQFVLDQSSGEITLAQQLDFETAAMHELVVKAEDATGSNTATVSVTVQDSNDNTPEFTLNPYTGSLSEADSSGTAVATVSATDLDTESNFGTVSYALPGSTNFEVNSATGVITNKAMLSADSGPTTYTLSVTATDSGGGAGALTGTSVVVVTVTPVNGNDPVFSAATTNVQISENQFSVGDVIATVTASDADSGSDGEFTFSFVSSQSKFSLSQRGVEADVRLEQDLDYENGDTSFNVEIKATDGGVPARSATGTVVITVDDANDNSPLCTSVVNVAKDEGETNIGSLTCSDADAGTTLSYSVVSTTPNTITPSVSSNGVVTVASALDYETDTSYVIHVKVTDDGVPQQSTTVTINLQVNDLNDNDPSLTGPFTFSVSESAGASSLVLYTATANSNDGPTDTLSFSLTDTTYFDVSSATGEITLKTQAPDVDTLGLTYMTDLCVEDSANPSIRSSCQTLTVSVLDVNDVSPVFDPAVYSGTVAENAAPPTNLATSVTASDGDLASAFNTITFSIVGGNTGGAFSIGPSTGVVSVAAALDYAVTPSYTLVVQASDGSNVATTNYNIQVLTVNLNDPVFTPDAETVTIDEDTPTNTTVAVTAVASDADNGDDGTLTYSMDAGPFSIDPTTGVIKVASSLDRETTTSYTLDVIAVDGGSTPRTGTLSLTVSIGDVNDETPTCSSTVYMASLLETASPGDPVATLVCTDDDGDPAGENNALTYTIVSGSTALFTVSNVGAVTVQAGASFDRESTASYELVVDVADQSTATKLTFTATVSVLILDVNDETPYFTSLATISEDEDTPVGTTITTVVAADDDDGVNAEIGYQIQSGNTGTTFTIDPLSGEVILLAELDYDTGPTEYHLVIAATDKGASAKSVTGTLTVSVLDVSDEPVVCPTSLYTAETQENAASTSLGVSVTCTKVDAAGSIAYSITAGDTNSDFSINPSTGALSTSAAADINFESLASYTLTVTASEGGFSAETTVRISVTDVDEFSPAFTPAGPYSASVDENVDIGYTVRVVAATDADTGDAVKIYSISGGNSDGKFMIGSSSGIVQVQAPLDFETTESYSLSLTVTDSGGSTGTVALNVDVNDINDNSPVCSTAFAAVDVDEGVTSGSLYTPTCTDEDTVPSSSLAYSIISGAHASISINTASGELSLVDTLDYETATNHVVIIEASDEDTPTPKTARVSVDIAVNPINELDPTFTPSNSYGPIFIDENTSTGTSIAQVAATDGDAGLDHGSIRFAIISGDDFQQFAIDENSGDISVVKALDRETTPTYSIEIRATDQAPGSAGQRSATAVVNIELNDINDLAPTFNPTFYTVDVLETASAGPLVVLQTMTVSDGDADFNAEFILDITAGNDEGKFSVFGTDLILEEELDYETTTSYDLVITATDFGFPTLESVARITVNVLPDNEAAPLMSSSSDSVSIEEDTPVGTLVYDANATDTDSGSDGTITYRIASGVPGNEFIIDESTGRLFVGSMLDFDTAPTSYSIIVEAEDGAGASDASTSTVSLAITLLDVNDHAPQFSTSLFTFDVEENSPENTLLGNVVVTDDDADLNGEFILSATGGSGASYITLDDVLVSTIAEIDYETVQVLYLSIEATDFGAPPLTSPGLIKVEVINMNDNNPVVTPAEFAVPLSESVVPGTSVHTLTATDADTAIDGFSLVSPSAYFQVDASSGLITTKAALDRETLASHVLHIRVLDLPTPGDPTTVRTSTATLTVLVEDENDNDPVITGSYSSDVEEGSGVNTLVFTVAATDADADENAQLTYAITAGNTGSAFSIDSQGNVQVAAALDRETTPSYSLTIEVNDQGDPPRSDQVNALVTITDVNDNDPVFSQASYTLEVGENSGLNSAVGSVVATDDDTGNNAALTFTFDAFQVGDSSHFAIDGATGAITVAQNSLDRETRDSYQATVKVMDNGSDLIRTAYATVTINIIDLNDNTPVFSSSSYSGSVAESAATSTTVLTVVATDADIGNNSDITYIINTALLDGPTASSYFE
ncbi:protocadherin fat 4, partial [Plakobranchus ocellatus]